MTFSPGGLRLWSALTLLILAACEPQQAPEPRTSSSSDAIIGGVAESSHWYVVMVGTSQGGSCTGTLLSRRTVITAGHCRNGSQSLTRVFFDTGSPLVRSSVMVTSSVRHPQYNGTSENDLTLVQLAADAPIQAVPLLRETMTNTAAWIGPKFTFVGFGDTNASGGGFGTRRVVTFPITLIGPSPVTHPGNKPPGSPSAIDSSEWYYRVTGKNTCFGDSGGPAFVVRNGVERHAGATSYGDSNCTYDGVQAKTDATTLTWIQQTIDLWEGAADPCKSDGVCGASCVSTVPVPRGTLGDPDCADQHCSADGVCVLSCAVADPDCATLAINDCTDNGICQANCLPADVDCATGTKLQGNGCSVGTECASGFCSSNVCCDTACLGGCEACAVNGACSVKAAATACRPVSGPCDVAESCTGLTGACPPDQFIAAAALCRPSAGVCDAPESCTGAAPTCPADTFEPASVACRPSAGPCDALELCSGAAPSCPADRLQTAGSICRLSASNCDVDEACDGVTPACPLDKVAAPGTVCRAANGQCDLPETCTGDAQCPQDQVAASGIVCRPANSECDAAEACSGSSNVCPNDQAAPNGTVCGGGTCASTICIPTPALVDAGPVTSKPDAGRAQLGLDAGASPVNPPRGCGCSTGAELFFLVAAFPLLVRTARRRPTVRA